MKSAHASGSGSGSGSGRGRGSGSGSGSCNTRSSSSAGSQEHVGASRLRTRGRIDRLVQSKMSSSSSSSSSSSLPPNKLERASDIPEDMPPMEPTSEELVMDLYKQIRSIEAFKNSSIYSSFCVVDKETLLAQTKFLSLLLNGGGNDDNDDGDDDDDDDDVENDDTFDINDFAEGAEEKKKTRSRFTVLSTSMDWLYKSLQSDLPLMDRCLCYYKHPDDDYPYERAIKGGEELKRLLIIHREHYERTLQPRLKRIPPHQWSVKDAEEIATHWLKMRVLYSIYENTLLKIVSNEAIQNKRNGVSTSVDPATLRPLHTQALIRIQNLPASAVECELSPLPMKEIGSPDWLPRRLKAIAEYHEYFEDCVNIHNESLIAKFIMKDRLRQLKVLCDQNKTKRTADNMSEEELSQWKAVLKDCQLLHQSLVNGGAGMLRRRNARSSSGGSTSSSATGTVQGSSKEAKQMYFFEKE